jgi:hypothetical protein
VAPVRHREMEAAQRLCVAERLGVAKIAGCYRVEALVCRVYYPQHLVCAHLLAQQMPWAISTASDLEILTPGAPRP